MSDNLKTLVRLPKAAEGEPTRWRIDVIAPRFSPFPKSRPSPADGAWRSIIATAAEHRFMVFAQVQEGRENFKAILALQRAGAWQTLVRLENHGSHPGLHVHDWCGKPPPIGGKSIDAPYRRPLAGSRHRRIQALTRATFWKLALDCFRVIPLGRQGEFL